jgi:hypothetical protein
MNEFDRILGSALKRVRDEHAASAPDRRRDMLRRGKRRRTLRLTGAAAGAVAVLVLAATAIPILRDEAAPGPAGETQPSVTETIDISLPAAIIANDENLWVASRDGFMSRIDASTNEVVEGPPVLSELGVKDMALGPDGIWAVAWRGDIGDGRARSELQVVDPESMETIEGSSFDGIALYSVTTGEQGTVWAVNAAGDQVFKMRAEAEAEALMEIPTGRFPVGVAAAAGSAWVSNSKSGTITEIDARATNTGIAARPRDVVGEFPVECPGDLVVAFGSLWVTNFCANQIRRIDLSGPRVVANIPTGKGPHALVEAGGFVWVLNTLDETVVRVDPSTNRVIGDPVDVGASPESIVSGGGAVWVANRNSVSRIDYEPRAGLVDRKERLQEELERAEVELERARCSVDLPWRPTYLPEGFTDHVFDESGYPSQPGVETPAIGHYRGTKSGTAGDDAPFIDVWVVPELDDNFDLYGNEITVLGREVGGAVGPHQGGIFESDDGTHVGFARGGCNYELVAAGLELSEVRNFAEGLVPASSAGARQSVDPDEGFAIWPETTPAQAEAACGSNAPGWRAEATEVGLRFVQQVVGWPDATDPDVLQLRKSGGAVMSISRSEGEPDVRVLVSVAPTLFGPDCLSVVDVSRSGDSRPRGLRLSHDVQVELSVRAEGAVMDLAWDPRGAVSAEVLVGFGDLEQVQTTTAPRCRFVFAGPITEPGYVLVLLEDDGGEVISAMGRPLPAGDFNER